MECIINDTRVKLKDGEIFSFIKKGNSPYQRWFLLKGCMSFGYKVIVINKKNYNYHRVIYKLHNNEWDIDDGYIKCIINDRKIKYEDGEISWWYSEGSRGLLKNPRWINFKQSKSAGYKCITIKNKKYKVHRVIYKIYNQDWDIDDKPFKNQIDHIDRNKLNNNINNLRVVSNQQNQFNRTCKGYSYDKRYNSYRVRIEINGESKSYNVKTEEEAIKLREELKIKYHTI